MPRDLLGALTAGATAIAGLIPNRALAQQVASAVVSAGAPMPPAVASGLASQQRIDDYVAAVHAFAAFSSAADLPLSALARWAFMIANNQLAAMGVPRVATRLDSAPTVAHFVARDWSMTLDLSHMAPAGAGPPTVRSLSPEALAEVAGVVYHEARHAEQNFRQARLLAGQHYDELYPPTSPIGPDDRLDMLVARAKLARLERRVVVLRLSIDLGIPESVMEQAAARPLRESGDDLPARVLGALAFGLPALTIGDLMSPGRGVETLVAAGDRGAALRDAMMREAADWYADESLEDLVYDRTGLIRGTLADLAAEVPKARTPAGMDIAVLHAARAPMKQIVDAIDAEADRLGWTPREVVMRGLLTSLKDEIMEIGSAVVELNGLQRDPDTPERTELIELQIEAVIAMVAMVDLMLRTDLYSALRTEADAYELGDRVRSAWRSADAP